MGLLIFLLAVLAALIAWEAVARAQERESDFYHKHEMERK
jgi:hypothetical protein